MGMLRVVVIIEAGNYDSKSTFIMTLIKQEKLVLIIGYLLEYLRVFTKLFTEDFQFRVFGSRNNRKRPASEMSKLLMFWWNNYWR